MTQDLEEIKNKLKRHDENLDLNNASIEESKFNFYRIKLKGIP